MSDIIKAEIKRLVNLVNDQAEEILSYPEVMPLIELDLLKESLRRLYQHVNYLSTPFNQPISTPKTEVTLEKEQLPAKEDEYDEVDIQAEALMQEAEENLFAGQEEEKEEVIVVEVKEEKVEDLLQQIEGELEKVVEETPAPVEETILPPKEETKVAEVKSTSHKEDILLVDRIGKTTITSLKSAISINDKFQFINDLFDGSMPRYNRFIQKLDDSEGLEHAENTLHEMQIALEWSDDNSAFVMLMDYLHRRF